MAKLPAICPNQRPYVGRASFSDKLATIVGLTLCATVPVGLTILGFVYPILFLVYVLAYLVGSFVTGIRITKKGT